MRRAPLVLVVLLCGCTGQVTSGSDLTLDEFTIDAASSTLSVGPQALTVSNVGEFGHTVVIADDTGHVVQASNVIDPGTQTTIDVDLPPGRYEFTCRIVVETEFGLVDHYEAGMRRTIVVDE